IEALDDERFTRSIEFGRNFIFSHHVLQVGDCALAILDRIAARHFKGTGRMYHSKPGENKKVVMAWWREFSEKGERMMVIEGTTAGAYHSPRQPRRLLERHPDAALYALTKGIRNCKEDWIRSNLLYIAEDLKGDIVLPLFRAELKGPTLASRLAAA